MGLTFDLYELWQFEKMNFKNFVKLKVVKNQNKLANRTFDTAFHQPNVHSEVVSVYHSSRGREWVIANQFRCTSKSVEV